MECNQVKLKSANRHMVCWVESYVKKGDEVRFKNDDRWWFVEQKYHPTLDKQDIKHDWKVGGLT